jgi:hypothetical protein
MPGEVLGPNNTIRLQKALSNFQNISFTLLAPNDCFSGEASQSISTELSAPHRTHIDLRTRNLGIQVGGQHD